jgi:FkbM family methyltransferase
MRKIFLDCGGNNGCSVRMFRGLYDKEEEYEIYSFEPNPVFDAWYDDLNVDLIKKAVWINDEELVFYQIENRQAGKESGASTLSKTKALNHKNVIVHELKVKGIDFSSWLFDNFKPEDEIILKMDIEGAEYEVLNRMCDDDTIKFINKLYVEFHWEKVGLKKEDHDNLLERLGDLEIEEWDAIQW